MSRGKILFITGTDTGAGKTVLTALLLAHLRSQGVNALAMKPVCTGPRSDVRLLQSLQRGELSDDEMNPFWYQTPVAPIVAATTTYDVPNILPNRNPPVIVITKPPGSEKATAAA